LVSSAKRLRQSMTKEERRLWFEFLRFYPVKIRRQAVLGKYIVDFYCAEAKLVVEIDGSQHYEKRVKEKDNNRTEFLKGYGIEVVRIPNSDINDHFREVCEYVDMNIKERVKLKATRTASPSRRNTTV